VESRRRQIAVVGAAEASAQILALAEEVGREIARHGGTVVCGGRTGVMEAVARGAHSAGGLTVGVLPTYDRDSGNPYLTVVIASGLGYARNAVVVAAGDAVIALPGEHGTLSEIALALKLGRRVVGLRAWSHLDGVLGADDAATAVALAFAP
jgi:hypothetical protein